MIKTHSFNRFDVWAFQKPKANKTVCGDSYFVNETDHYFIGALVDGLGSGKEANIASQIAVDIITRNADSPVDVLVQKVNHSLIGYRGVVLTVFKINYKSKLISYCSVGNIQFVIGLPDGGQITPIPRRGFLSGRPIKVQKEVYPYPHNAIFMIYTDGFTSENILKKINYESSREQVMFQLKPLFNEKTEPLDDMTILIGKPKG